jgi:uncharacterized membrane protein
MSATQPQTRPIGITILAIVAVLATVASIVVGSDLIETGTTVPGAISRLGGLAPVLGVVMILVGALNLVLAYGFWTLKSWGWPLGVGLWAANIVLNVLQYLNDSNVLIPMGISVIVGVAVLYYLFRPHVKAAFGRT